MIHLGPKYINLLSAEEEVHNLVKKFHRAHGFPQCLGAIDELTSKLSNQA